MKNDSRWFVCLLNLGKLTGPLQFRRLNEAFSLGRLFDEAFFIENPSRREWPSLHPFDTPDSGECVERKAKLRNFDLELFQQLLVHLSENSEVGGFSKIQSTPETSILLESIDFESFIGQKFRRLKLRKFLMESELAAWRIQNVLSWRRDYTLGY